MKTPVAFCRLHQCPLSWSLIKRNGCIGRKQHRYGRSECRHLRKNEEHPIWEQRRKLKELKKARRGGR